MQPAAGRSLLALCLAVAASARRPQPSDLEKVQKLRLALAKVADQPVLSGPLRAEARAVAASADRALRGRRDPAALTEVVGEYRKFLGDLAHREVELKQTVDASVVHNASAGATSQAASFARTLAAKVRKTLAHILAEGTKGMSGEEVRERASVVAELNASLVADAGSNASAVSRALKLHGALEDAHGYFSNRTAALTRQEAQLSHDIQKGQAWILYNMLKQRKSLPMGAQLAILKRRQFKKFAYAQALLKNHSKSTPLFEQLARELPRDLAPQAPKKGAAEHLAAAGSDGRVQIVSSRLKGRVKAMMQYLASSRDKLRRLAEAKLNTTATAKDRAEQKEAKVAVADLDKILAKANKTADLKTQLEAMFEVQKEMADWTKKMTAS